MIEIEKVKRDKSLSEAQKRKQVNLLMLDNTVKNRENMQQFEIDKRSKLLNVDAQGGRKSAQMTLAEIEKARVEKQ